MFPDLDQIIVGIDGVTPNIKRRLISRYGAGAVDIAQNARIGELECIPGSNTLWAELRYAAKNENVVHLDDLMSRRLRLGITLNSGGTDFFTKIKNIVQSELGLIYMNQILGEENKTLTDYLAEIKALRGIIPICARCQKVRDDEGYWTKVETYIEERSEAQFSHGLCENCSDELYGDKPWYQKIKTKH